MALKHLFEGAKARDALVKTACAGVVSGESPSTIVGKMTPLVGYMTRHPKDGVAAQALERCFEGLKNNHPKEGLVMVALHIMGCTNQEGYQSSPARSIAFDYIQHHLRDTLRETALYSHSNPIVGLLFAARSVVKSSLAAGNIREARLIVDDLQAAIVSLHKEGGGNAMNEGTVPVRVIGQVWNETSTDIDKHFRLLEQRAVRTNQA